MKKHYPLSQLLPIAIGMRCVFLLAMLAATQGLDGQTCQVAISPVVTALTPATVNDVAQSVTMTSCPNGNFTSITVYHFTSRTEVRLRIYSGTDLSAIPIYTATSLTLFDDLILGTTFNFSVPFLSGGVYTFRFDIDAPSFFQFSKSTLNVYSGGSLYENTVQISGEDLKMLVMTDVNLLPVELTSFDARPQNNQTLLTWRTASEQNNAGFGIERSPDGREWESLAFVPGNGTSAEAQDYHFTDERPLPGINYYRLRQEDYDGAIEYSDVKSVFVKSAEAENGISIFPNPAQKGGSLQLRFSGEAVRRVMLTDGLGRTVFTAENESEAMEIDLRENLAAGIYTLTVSGDAGQVLRKAVLVN